MKDDSLLTIPVTAKVAQTKTVFQQHDKKIIINAPGSLMEQMVALCDGTLTKMQIIDSLASEWDKECVVELVDELLRLELLINLSIQSICVEICGNSPPIPHVLLVQ